MKHKTLVLALSALLLVGCQNEERYASFELPKNMEVAAQAADPLKSENKTPLKTSHPQFVNDLATFSGDFIDKSMSAFDNKEDNSCISPVSLFGAMGMVASATTGDAQDEILSMLGMSLEEVEAAAGPLVENLSYEAPKDAPKGLCTFDNAMFLQDGHRFNQEGLNHIADKHYASSYILNFLHMNAEANRAMTEYIDRKTHGLIKPELGLDVFTVLVFMNTLYLKTVWSGFDMGETDNKDVFTQRDGSTERIKYLKTPYLSGRQNQHDTFSSFGIPLTANCSLRLMVPGEGHTLNDIKAVDWTAVAHETYAANIGNAIYNTRAFFPAFTIEGDFDLLGLLKSGYGINTLFTDPDFSPISEDPLYVTGVRQLTKLITDKEGVEGAAVTVVECGATAVEPLKQNVYEEFYANKAFAYEVVNEKTDAILFAGFVNSL